MWVDDMVTSLPPLEAVDVFDIIWLIFFYYGVILVVPIFFTGLSIYKHLSYWTKPNEQKRIVVLVSIPIVIGVVSCVALHVNEDSKTISLLLDSIKESSAALGIPMFMGLLQAHMDLDTSDISPAAFRLKIRGRLIHNVFPVTLVQPRSVALDQNKLGLLNFWTWQYVVVRLVCTVFMIAFQLGGINPLWLSWTFFVLLNLSAFVAYYTVYAFYQAFVEDFPRHVTNYQDFEEDFPRHLSNARFLYIRGIFFVCFWQSLVVKVLGATGLTESSHFWRQELHNSLLVFETIIFTAFHLVSYSYRFYIPGLPLFKTN